MDAINKGAAKKPFLGSKVSGVEGFENLDGVGALGAAAVATLLVNAGVVLAAFAPILKMIDKNKGVKDGESTDDLLKEADAAGADLTIPDGEVSDPDPGSDKAKKKSDGSGFSLSSIDFKDPLTIGLMLVGGYLGAKALKIIK